MTIKAKRKILSSLALIISIFIGTASFSSCTGVREVFTDVGFKGYDEAGLAIVPDNDFHTALQYTYLIDKDLSSAANYARGVEELSRPRPFTLDFTSDKNIKDSATYVLQYSDNASFENCRVAYLTERKFDLYNLKLGQDLYWRSGATGDDLTKSTVYHFKVASIGPRNLFVDGVTNVRDVGGYDSSLIKGGKIKQGLLYRGACLDTITESGIETLTGDLGVREEIDIRDAELMFSPFNNGGDHSVNYTGVEIRSNTETRRFSDFAAEYKTIFSIIANADKAPVYLHCQAGADRTGLVASMLLAVCGVGYEDIARDYMFSNFSIGGNRLLDGYFSLSWWWGELEKIDGSTHADKAANWLKTKGITAEQIETIRKIFIEGY